MPDHPLRGIYRAAPPFVSVYLDTSGAHENANTELEVRWKDILHALDELGVDGATQDALTAARGDSRLGSTRALVAAGGRVRYAESWPGRVDHDIVRVGSLPYLLPVLCREQQRVAHVIALVDRRGADILAYRGDTAPDVVDGLDATPYPIHKTGAGGWAAHRYENTVEENWRKGAKAVAELIRGAVDDVGAEVVFVAGDVKETALVLDHLATVRARVERIRGGRAVDGSDTHVADAVTERLEGYGRARDAEVLTTFADGLGDGNGRPLSVDGPAPTVAALRAAAGATLLVSPAAEGQITAWFGPDLLQLALTPKELADEGVEVVGKGDLLDVAVRAALGGDASVRVVPADADRAPTEGIGAILRYSA
jgi:hypothetical protein